MFQLVFHNCQNHASSISRNDSVGRIGKDEDANRNQDCGGSL